MTQRILLIDDEQLMRSCIGEALKRAGYEVTAAASGAEGVEAFRTNSYELVLSDLKMPGTDGMEVLEKIKAENNRIPFILMTTCGSISTAAEAMKRGAVDFIEKPFSSFDQLEIKVAHALELSRLRDENKNLRALLKRKEEGMEKNRAMHDVDAPVKTAPAQKQEENIDGLTPGMTVAEMEKQLIYKTLEASGNNRTRAAEVLGISIRTLRNKLQEYESKKPVEMEQE